MRVTKRCYVTLFDSNYLTRGLVMYRSLLSHSSDFHLWIICFDDLTYKLLHRLKLDKVTLVALSSFEDPELLSIKSSRTRQEYCWTCTPSAILYVLDHVPYVDAVTYLDADLMFFSSPEPIFIEAIGASILLIEHRYLSGLDVSATSGIYNVQFMMFRRDLEGLKALNWWRDRCLEWCFARCEDNKFGDQKYLDDWLERFEKVHVLRHLGAGLAPWNASQYSLKKIDGSTYVENDLLIFYHFHQFKLYPFNLAHLCPYPINKSLINWVYEAYLQGIGQAYKEIRAFAPKFKHGIIDFQKPPKRPGNLYRFLRDTLKDIKSGKYCRYG